MAYNPTLVQMTFPPSNDSQLPLTFSGLCGFPAVTFNYLLFSYWICLGSAPGDVSVNNIISFFGVTANSTSVEVILKSGLTTTFNGTFTSQVPFINNYRTNVIMSVDQSLQVIQVYLNDVACALSTGGWITPGPFNIDDLPLFQIGSAGSSGAPTPAAGDIYVNAPLAFYDLSIVGNRRKFINADLTPVDLGSGGAGPTGSQPPVFLSCRTGVANDMATNYGLGGAYALPNGNLVLQPGGVCLLPTPPPPTEVNVPITGVSATASVGILTATNPLLGVVMTIPFLDVSFETPTKTDHMVTLRWSDDGGFNWSNGLVQSLGLIGEYSTSVQFRRIGMAGRIGMGGRTRVLELSWSGAQAEALTGVFLQYEIAGT